MSSGCVGRIKCAIPKGRMLKWNAMSIENAALLERKRQRSLVLMSKVIVVWYEIYRETWKWQPYNVPTLLDPERIPG
jgi:hypothetical protein